MKILKLGFVGFLIVFLSACGISNYVFPKGTRLTWDELTVIAMEGANLNTPVALDIVLLHDEVTLGLVAALPAEKWFSSRTDLVNTFPQGLSYHSMEIAPGQSLKPPVSTFGKPRLAGVIMFANYLTPGEHRVRVEQLKGDILVQLGVRSFSLVTPKTK